MKKQRPRDHSQNEEQNPKPQAGRQPGDRPANRRKTTDQEDLERTEIEEEAELKEKDETGKNAKDTAPDEEIVNKKDQDTKIGGKGRTKIVNKKD